MQNEHEILHAANVKQQWTQLEFNYKDVYIIRSMYSNLMKEIAIEYM